MAEKKDKELSEKDLKKAAGGGLGMDTAMGRTPKSPLSSARDQKATANPLGTAKGRLGDAGPDKGKKG